MSRVVVIGESGQLAQSLRKLSWPAGCEPAFHGRRSFGDGLGPDRLRDLVQSEGAHLVLNAAAYTGVDPAESEPHAAAALNAELPLALATVCEALDIPLVHVSSDYVFDGEKQSPYREDDEPHPLSVYGETKLAGDRNVEQAGLLRWAILRTSWVVSETGETFPVKLLRRARAGEPLRVVDDQWGCPTAASDLARAMQSVGLRLLDGDRASVGLFNFCGAFEMSWHGFAERLLSAAEAKGVKRPPLQAIKSVELSAPARRPAYSVLSCARIKRVCDISGVGIEDDLERMVRAVLAA